MSNTNTTAESKSLNDYTREELLALPERHWDTESIYHSIILLPSDDLHDSNYRCMVIIGVIDGVPVEIAASGCDDIEWLMPTAQIAARHHSTGQMRMDCLDISKAFHPWSYYHNFKVGSTFSSITIELIYIEQE